MVRIPHEPVICRFIGIVLVAAFASSPISAAEVDWRARFLAEAPAAWEAYREANRHLQGTCRGERQEQDGTRDNYDIEIKVNESCRLIRAVEPKSTEVFGKNPKYVFHLRTGKDGNWMLLGVYQAEELREDRAKWIEERIDRYSTATVDAIGRVGPDSERMGDLLKADRIRIASAVPKLQDGANLIEVQFETIDPPGSNPGLFAGGTLLLDPNRDWLIISQISKTRHKAGTGTHTIRFDFGPGSHPPPSRSDWRQVYNLFARPEPKWHTGQEEMDLRVPKRLPDTTEFTLTAFGLPEPVGVTWEKPMPRYAWFLMATAAFAGVAVLFTYLARRARARRATVA